METRVLRRRSQIKRRPFPPTLDQFNLIDSDIDPSLVEQVLEDSRYGGSLSLSLSLSPFLSHYLIMAGHTCVQFSRLDSKA